MQTPINKDNIDRFAATNLTLFEDRPRSLVLEFHGLGDGHFFTEAHPLGRTLAQKGAAFVIPYYGPWAWMNDKAVGYIDEVVGAVFDKYGEMPIVSTGLSMGGLGALAYCLNSRHAPVACAANCPVCDLAYHYTERPDVARTVYFAFSHYDCGLDEAMKTVSPLHLVGRLPRIPYRVFAATADVEVDPEKHSYPFVLAMKEAGYDVDLIVMKDRAHCDLDPASLEKYVGFISSFGD